MTIEEFMTALKYHETLTLSLRGVGETLYSTQEIYELIQSYRYIEITDEDIQDAINDVECSMHDTYSRKLAITALQQMQKEPCEWCGGDGIPCLGVIDSIYCCRCGRKLR